jgi:murein DD-endopeptidase MepM/ murein hydrolase activator NlpD
MQPVDFPYDAADPFGHIRPNGRAHTGSDWLCPTGTVVRAVLPGVVTATGWNDGNGFYCAQSLPDGRFWSYIHLSQIDCTVGQTLAEGDRVGLSGNTGSNSFGPHLHCSLSTSPSVFVGAPTLSDPWAFLQSVPPTPPTPARKKKNVYSMAAVLGEPNTWIVFAPGFFYEIKQRPGLTLAQVQDQMRKWNAQTVNSGNFEVTRAQANELKAMCLK